MKIKNLVLASVLGVSSTLVAISASAAINVTMGGNAVANEGLYTSVVGASTTNFNDTFLPSNYIGGGVVDGGASPPNDITHYFSIGPSTSTYAYVFTGLASYFGFYAGSLDTYNKISFWNSATDTVVASFSGTQLAEFADTAPNGNLGLGFFWNFTAADSSSYFDIVGFESEFNAFETDNHAVLTAVPEPETYAMMIIGLALVGFGARSRKNS